MHANVARVPPRHCPPIWKTTDQLSELFQTFSHTLSPDFMSAVSKVVNLTDIKQITVILHVSWWGAGTLYISTGLTLRRSTSIPAICLYIAGYWWNTRKQHLISHQSDKSLKRRKGNRKWGWVIKHQSLFYCHILQGRLTRFSMAPQTELWLDEDNKQPGISNAVSQQTFCSVLKRSSKPRDTTKRDRRQRDWFKGLGQRYTPHTAHT